MLWNKKDLSGVDIENPMNMDIEVLCMVKSVYDLYRGNLSKSIFYSNIYLQLLIDFKSKFGDIDFETVNNLGFELRKRLLETFVMEYRN